MKLDSETLQQAISALPSGRWALALSGGADSVALLHLAHERGDLQIVAVHLDHEMRGGESSDDARFVQGLCHELGVALVSARRSEIEHAGLPANPQARFRMLRLELFARAIREHQLQGVLQAHHADDQAETVFMRLLRGTGIEGLAGIPADTTVAGVRIIRPLLGVRRAVLREYLTARHLTWREDSSNRSTKYQRNRVRQLLAGREELVKALLQMQKAFAQLNAQLETDAPRLPETFRIRDLTGRDRLLQLHALRAWAIDRGTTAVDLTQTLLERLRAMVEDMGAPPAVCLPGGIEVRRRKGMITSVQPAPADRQRNAPEPPDPS